MAMEVPVEQRQVGVGRERAARGVEVEARRHMELRRTDRAGKPQGYESSCGL